MDRNINPMDHDTFRDQRIYALQLGRLLGDPLLGLWIDQDVIEQFGANELDAMDPASARIAEAEAAWLRLRYRQTQDQTG